MHFSKKFVKAARILTGLKCSFTSFLHFLCDGVTLDNFKKEGKFADSIAPIMDYARTQKPRKQSIFSLRILLGISDFCEALVLPDLRISFPTYPIFTSSK